MTTSRVDLARSYILKMAAIYVLLFGYIGVDKSDILGVVRTDADADEEGTAEG